jgi:hypothetical protein
MQNPSAFRVVCTWVDQNEHLVHAQQRPLAVSLGVGHLLDHLRGAHSNDGIAVDQLAKLNDDRMERDLVRLGPNVLDQTLKPVFRGVLVA